MKFTVMSCQVTLFLTFCLFFLVSFSVLIVALNHFYHYCYYYMLLWLCFFFFKVFHVLSSHFSAFTRFLILCPDAVLGCLEALSRAFLMVSKQF